MTPAQEYACFPKDRFVTASDGTTIAYTVLGDGGEPPVLFVNGWSCTDTYWSGIAPALVESGHPALLVDTRGHGQSGLPRPPGFNSFALRDEDVSVERVAADFVEVLDDAGIEKVALAGHSIGVELIFEIYRQVPDRVVALFPVAGTFENPVQSFAGLPVLDRLFPIADVLFRVLPFGFLQPVVRRISAPDAALTMLRAMRVAGPKVTADRIAPHVIQICEIDFSVLWRMIHAFRNHRAAVLLPEVAVPTLVFAGRKDLFAPPAVQERMQELIPDCEVVWFEEGGHMLPAEEPEAIVAGMLDLLAGPGGRPRESGRRGASAQARRAAAATAAGGEGALSSSSPG